MTAPRQPDMSDDDLRSLALGFRDGILGSRSSDGMCYAVAAPLVGLLSFYGFAAELELTDHSDNPNSDWYEHYWIRLPDGRVLDPTFDQFRAGEPVYLGPPTEFHTPASARCCNSPAGRSSASRSTGRSLRDGRDG